jgi:hypothetical protein
MLPVVLYGCETRSLTFREGHRFRVYENGVLRKIFGPKSDPVTREWRKLHNKKLCDLYSSPNFIRLIKLREWDGRGMWHVWSIQEMHTGLQWGKLMGREH